MRSVCERSLGHDDGAILARHGKDATSCRSIGLCLSTVQNLHQLSHLFFPFSLGPVHANVLAASTTVSEGTLQQEAENGPAARGRQNRRSASRKGFTQPLLTKSLLCE